MYFPSPPPYSEYRLISKKGEGTFSEVVKAQMIKTNKFVAIKRMKNHFDSIEQVNNLRETMALKKLSPHPCVIKLVEVLL
jgi:renal tumor antigen